MNFFEVFGIILVLLFYLFFQTIPIVGVFVSMVFFFATKGEIENTTTLEVLGAVGLATVLNIGMVYLSQYLIA